MKRAILIHGWEGAPEEGWRPWLSKELKQHDFEVIAPAMPEPMTPTMSLWVSHLQQVVGTPDEDTYLVGHSLGCITVLRYLETLKEDEKIGGAILVAGFGEDLYFPGYKNQLKGFFKTPIEWEKIKSHCMKFFVLHSQDDPLVDPKNLELFKEKLNAKALLENGMKHYSGDDGITVLPIVLDELLLMSNSQH